jgi:hypothetical protein
MKYITFGIALYAAILGTYLLFHGGPPGPQGPQGKPGITITKTEVQNGGFCLNSVIDESTGDLVAVSAGPPQIINGVSACSGGQYVSVKG